MRAEIMAVGTELLLGDILNTNAQFLAQELANLGIEVYYQTVVGDNPQRLKDTIFHAFSRADLIITIGGLGPTEDDLTKETAAKYFGVDLVLDEKALARIQKFFDRFGRKTLTYAKVHTCDFGVEKDLTPGEDFFVSDLDTEKGIIKVGAMICYDREFPESARILMLKGAELILVPNACPMEINRLSQLRGRAFENMVAIATCNYPETVPDCNGGSSLFDGVAYLPELSGSRDTCLLLADGKEGVYVAGLDLDMLRSYRTKEVHGNAYRRPEKYGLILKNKIDPPFIRNDKR